MARGTPGGMLRAGSLIVAACLAVSVAATVPLRVRAAACPTSPWTLADIVAVPSLWGETTWPPEGLRRAACFGSSRIAFVARGGLVTEVLPGVEITGQFGRLMSFASRNDGAATARNLNAWLPTRVMLGPDDEHAVEMTSPGMGEDGWVAVWWQARGHFNDPASVDCRPDNGTVIGGIPMVLTAAQAVELCRNEFVLDSLHWLRSPPTDTIDAPAPLRFDAPLAILLFGVAGGGVLIAASLTRRFKNGERRGQVR
jgi:hypothetical protein